MRILIVLALFMAFGCSQKERASPKTVRSPEKVSADVKKLLMDGRREQIQLLAVKHRLPPDRTELATWEYFEKHDIGFRFLNERIASKRAITSQDMIRVTKESSVGMSETVKSLAFRYDLREESLAAFLAELRASQPSQN